MDVRSSQELLQSISRFYGLEVQACTPVRRIYRLETDKGIKGLKQTTFPKARIQFMQQGVEHLLRQGYTKIATIYPTLRGDSTVNIGQGLYYLVDWLNGRECDFNLLTELEEAVIALAEFHQKSKNFDAPAGCKPKVAWDRWPDNFNKGIQKLIDYKYLVESTKELSPFDYEYLTWVDYFVEQGKTALKILQSSSYQGLCSQGRLEKSLCHHDVSARNFIFNKGQASLIDLEFLRYDIRTYDLGRLILRTLFDLDGGFELANKIIDIYNQVCPLRPEEYTLLLAINYYPQKFWRTAEGFYRQNPRWTGEDYLFQLKSTIAHEQKRAPFLTELHKFCGLGRSSGKKNHI